MMKTTTLGFVSIVALLAGAGSAGAETLSDALTMTYQNNPTLDAQRAALRATDERVAMALSGWRPTVVMESSASLSHEGTELRVGNQIHQLHRNFAPWSVDLRVTQPVYDGGKTSASVRAADNSVQSGRAQLRSVEQRVLFAAVQAYIGVLTNQAILELNKKNVAVLKRDLQANHDRFRVGEITQTDVSQSEASLAGAVSKRVTAQSNLDAARQAYRQVVGKAPGDLAPPPPLPDLPPSLQEAQQIAEKNNPDLDQARFQEAVAKDNIDVARSAIRPQVSVVGELSHAMNGSFGGQHTNQAAISARVTVPIYQSGSEYATIRQNQQTASQALSQISASQRVVAQNTADAWNNLHAALSVIVSSQQQIKANKLALEGTRQEAAVGTRTVLDVLNAEQAILNSRVSLVQDKGREYTAAFTLLQAIGRLSVSSLNLSVQRYDATKHYEKARALWFGYD